MKTLGQRLAARMEELGIKQDELAKLSGVSQPTISQIVSGRNKGSRYAVQLAAALRVSPEWLVTGREDKVLDRVNVTDGPLIRAKVPVISWAAAGTWSDVEDPFRPGEAEEWTYTTKTVSPSAFALRVLGDSMEPTIPANSVVVIDPGAAPAHGRVVLAKRTQDQQATLKTLWYDGATPMLKPLNPRYPMMEMPPDTRIIGVAVTLVLDL
jgi:SOS-response transcriptional repressor LexA